MVGDRKNRKLISYVENVDTFIGLHLRSKPGVYACNNIDKLDFSSNQLVCSVKRVLGEIEKVGFFHTYIIGYLIGKGFCFVASVSEKRFAISLIGGKKFEGRNIMLLMSTCKHLIFPTVRSAVGALAIILRQGGSDCD